MGWGGVDGGAGGAILQLGYKLNLLKKKQNSDEYLQNTRRS